MKEDGSIHSLRIDLHLSGIKASVMQMLHAKGKEVQQEFDAAFQRAVDDFDINKCIRTEVQHQIEAAMKRSVTAAIHNLFWEKEVMDLIGEVVSENLRKELRGL